MCGIEIAISGPSLWVIQHVLPKRRAILGIVHSQVRSTHGEQRDQTSIGALTRPHRGFLCLRRKAARLVYRGSCRRNVATFFVWEDEEEGCPLAVPPQRRSR